jgi:chromosome segregation ATPase
MVIGEEKMEDITTLIEAARENGLAVELREDQLQIGAPPDSSNPSLEAHAIKISELAASVEAATGRARRQWLSAVKTASDTAETRDSLKCWERLHSSVHRALATARDKVRDARNQLGTLLNYLAACQNQITGLERRLDATRGDLYQARSAIERAESQLRRISERKAATEIEIGELSILSSQLAETESRLKNAIPRIHEDVRQSVPELADPTTIKALCQIAGRMPRWPEGLLRSAYTSYPSQEMLEHAIADRYLPDHATVEAILERLAPYATMVSLIEGEIESVEREQGRAAVNRNSLTLTVSNLNRASRKLAIQLEQTESTDAAKTAGLINLREAVRRQTRRVTEISTALSQQRSQLDLLTAQQREMQGPEAVAEPRTQRALSVGDVVTDDELAGILNEQVTLPPSEPADTAPMRFSDEELNQRIEQAAQPIHDFRS